MRILPTLFILFCTSCGIHTHEKHSSESDKENKENTCPRNTYDTGDMCMIREFNKCGTHFERRCSDKEIAFIKDIEFLKQKIQYSGSINSDLESHFHYYKNDFSWTNHQTISFMSEYHDDFQIKLDNAAMILKNLKKGDVLLFEGAHSMDELSCEFTVLHSLYCALEWSRLGKQYTPDGKYDFCASNVVLWKEVERELNLSSLKLNQVKCYGWDDFTSQYPGSSLEGLRYRNDSLIKTLQNFEYEKKNIFVTFGFFHSPIGEFVGLSQKYWDHKNLPDFYAAMSDEEVTTEGIYNYLKDKRAVHYVHKRLVQGNEGLLPERVH